MTHACTHIQTDVTVLGRGNSDCQDPGVGQEGARVWPGGERVACTVPEASHTLQLGCPRPAPGTCFCLGKLHKAQWGQKHCWSWVGTRAAWLLQEWTVGDLAGGRQEAALLVPLVQNGFSAGGWGPGVRHGGSEKGLDLHVRRVGSSRGCRQIGRGCESGRGMRVTQGSPEPGGW